MSSWICVAGERAVVHADLVDRAVEPLVPDRVAADPEEPGRGGHRAGRGEGVGEGAVHVDAKRGAVVGRREVRPGVGRKRGGRLHALVVAADEDVAARPEAGRGGVEPVHEVAALLLQDDRPPAGVRRRRAHPRLERHLVGEIERGGSREPRPGRSRRRRSARGRSARSPSSRRRSASRGLRGRKRRSCRRRSSRRSRRRRRGRRRGWRRRSRCRPSG